MKKNLNILIILCLLSLISCNGAKKKDAAIEHLCNCLNVLISIQKPFDEFGKVLQNKTPIVTDQKSTEQDILGAYDSLAVAQKIYNFNLDRIIANLEAIKHIDSKTKFQENSLGYLRNMHKILKTDFKSIYVKNKLNPDTSGTDKYANLRDQITIISHMRDSIYSLQEKFTEEFELSEDELKQVADCATK